MLERFANGADWPIYVGKNQLVWPQIVYTFRARPPDPQFAAFPRFVKDFSPVGNRIQRLLFHRAKVWS